MTSKDDNPGNLLSRWYTDVTELSIIFQAKGVGLSGRGALSLLSETRLEFIGKDWHLTVEIGIDWDLSSPRTDEASNSAEVTFSLGNGSHCMLVGPIPFLGSISLQ